MPCSRCWKPISSRAAREDLQADVASFRDVNNLLNSLETDEVRDVDVNRTGRHDSTPGKPSGIQYQGAVHYAEDLPQALKRSKLQQVS
jgi:hypothetical protein